VCLIEGNFIPLHIMKAYRGRRGLAPLIFNLGAGRGCVAKPRLLYLLVKSPVPIE